MGKVLLVILACMIVPPLFPILIFGWLVVGFIGLFLKGTGHIR